MTLLWRITSLRGILLRNLMRRGSSADQAKTRSMMVGTFVVLVGIGYVAFSFFDPFSEIARHDPAMRLVLERMPSFAFFSSFWLLMLSGVTVGIQGLYTNPEMQLFLSAPVSRKSVFSAKLIEATLTNASLFITVGAPILFAYSYARGLLTVPYLMILLVCMFAFAVLPTAIGVLSSIVLMRVLPAGKARELLGAVGIAVFAAAYFVMSVGIRNLSNTGTMRQGTLYMSQLMNRPVFSKGPWAWAGDILNRSSEVGAIALPTALLITVALASFVLAVWGCVRLHWHGWWSNQEAALESARTSGFHHWDRRLPMLPMPVRAVVMKDLSTLRRDMRQLSLFLIPIAMSAVFLAHVQQLPGAGELPSAILGLALYPILAMISLRLASSGFIAESRAMWLVLVSPNPARDLVLGKFLYAYLLSLPIAIITMIAFAGMVGLFGIDWLLTFFIAVTAVAGFCAIGVGASVLFSDFAEEGSRMGMSVSARFATFFVQMGYLAVISIVIVAGWGAERTILHSGLSHLASLTLVLMVTSGVVVIPLLLCARRLTKLEWT